MPDEQQTEAPTADGWPVGDTVPNDDVAPADDARSDEVPGAARPGGRIFSAYGLVSAALGLVSVAAVVAGLITWSMHRGDVIERTYRSRVLQAAASWTSVLINLNADNVEKGMQRLRDKTAGPLNSEFEAAIQPYREVVQRIQSHSTGRVEAAAIESVHHDPDESGSSAMDSNERLPASVARRTDPVMVVATSVAENVGGKPETVHWALHLDVSDVNGQLLISRMKSIR